MTALLVRCVRIEGPTVIKDSTIGDNCRIGAFSHLEQVRLLRSLPLIHLSRRVKYWLGRLQESLFSDVNENLIRAITLRACRLAGKLPLYHMAPLYEWAATFTCEWHKHQQLGK